MARTAFSKKNYHVICRRGSMNSFVFFECRVQIVAPSIIDEEGANVGIGLRTDHLGDHFEVFAECSNT